MKLLSGNKLAVTAKVIFVSITLAVLGLLAQSAFASGEGFIAAFIAFSMVTLAIIYFTKISIPMKFFLPGVLLLAAFVVLPIAYTLVMSGFQFKTGNYVDKPAALERIVADSYVADDSGLTFDVVVGQDGQGDVALLATDYMTSTYFLSTEKAITELDASQVSVDPDLGIAVETEGFTRFSDDELASRGDALSAIKFAGPGEYFLGLEGFEVAIPFKPSLVYDEASDSFTNMQTGAKYADNGRGNFANIDDPQDIVSPGWRSPIWFENYVSLVTDEKVREPFIAVFIWTMVFAISTVVTQFALGLLVALALDKPLRGRRFYRIIIILPYAVPSIMSILIWGGMFDTEFGAINALLGTKIAWFLDENFARAAVIIVNLWLGFPYFYLISNGSLQAIPGELSEAARIDGASNSQIFWQITLPLLLKMLTPLLIASFAFNFNNFNLIFLLTGGGPRNDLDGEIAGATDILISYTYKIAFGSQVQDLGLASAISVVIFILVAGISLYGIRRSKVLEEFI
jgi:arabinogalactan oligomer/maltooligosaccharide transport system permease protein